MLPSRHRLMGIIDVSWEQNLWLKGTLSSNADIAVELSFETGVLPSIPGTDLTYIGVWHRRTNKVLFELQGNVICEKPTEELLQSFILPLIERVKGYRPLKIELPTFDASSSVRRDHTS